MSRSRLVALLSVVVLFLLGAPAVAAAAATPNTLRVRSVKVIAEGAGVRIAFVARCHKVSGPEGRVAITAWVRQTSGKRIASGRDDSRIFRCTGRRQVVHMVVGANDAPFHAGVALLKGLFATGCCSSTIRRLGPVYVRG
jgi:hypothetical protein